MVSDHLEDPQQDERHNQRDGDGAQDAQTAREENEHLERPLPWWSRLASQCTARHSDWKGDGACAGIAQRYRPGWPRHAAAVNGIAAVPLIWFVDRIAADRAMSAARSG
jgi:hypothetical protein